MKTSLPVLSPLTNHEQLVLTTVHDQRGINPKLIAEQLDIKLASACRSLAKLLKLGFVYKTTKLSDMRKKYYFCTCQKHGFCLQNITENLDKIIFSALLPYESLTRSNIEQITTKPASSIFLSLTRLKTSGFVTSYDHKLTTGKGRKTRFWKINYLTTEDKRNHHEYNSHNVSATSISPSQTGKIRTTPRIHG